MKARHFLLLPLLLAGTSAHATVGMLCRPVAGEGPQLSLVIGHGSGIVGANLRESEKAPWRSSFGAGAPLTLEQGWIDRTLLMVDLAESSARSVELRLRARFDRPLGHTAHGTISRGGRTWRVRCEQD